MTRPARLELRIAENHKELIERAAELSGVTVTAFVTTVLVKRASELVNGRAGERAVAPRPVGGWSFGLPEGWDAPLDDLSDYR